MSQELFTLGIVFSSDMEFIFLIRKSLPLYQKGKLNGVGGKVLSGETYEDNMARKSLEEVGYSGEWKRLGLMRWWGTIDCALFYSVMEPGQRAPHKCSEAVELIAVKDLPAFRWQMVPPLFFIIQAALENLIVPNSERFRMEVVVGSD